MKKIFLALFLAASVAGAQSYDANGNLLIRVERIQGSAPSATNPLPTRLTDGSVFIVPVLDTTLTARWPTGSTPGDNESNAVTTTRVGSFTYVFDGSAWDRWTGVVTANQGGTWTIDTITNPVAVTGTFFQATQPVSSTQLPAALVGGRLDVVIGAAVPAGNNNIGDVDVASLPNVTIGAAIPAGTNNIGDVDVATLPLSTTTSVTSVAASASNVTCLASNVNGRGGSIYNDSTVDVYIKLGATASTSSFTVKVYADGYFQIPHNYTGIIDCIWASATGNARVTEATP